MILQSSVHFEIQHISNSESRMTAQFLTLSIRR